MFCIAAGRPYPSTLLFIFVLDLVGSGGAELVVSNSAVGLVGSIYRWFIAWVRSGDYNVDYII